MLSATRTALVLPLARTAPVPCVTRWVDEDPPRHVVEAGSLVETLRDAPRFPRGQRHGHGRRARAVDLFRREHVRTKHSESRVNSAQAAPTSTPAPAPCSGTHGRRCCQSMRHAPAARFRVSASTVLLGVGLVPELVEGRRALPAHRPRGRALTHAQRLNLAFSRASKSTHLFTRGEDPFPQRTPCGPRGCIRQRVRRSLPSPTLHCLQVPPHAIYSERERARDSDRERERADVSFGVGTIRLGSLRIRAT